MDSVTQAVNFAAAEAAPQFTDEQRKDDRAER